MTERRKVYTIFKDKIWAADLTQIGSLGSSNSDVNCLLCVIGVFTKYTWVKSLKDKI